MSESKTIEHASEHGHHVSSPAQLIGIFLALLTLTGVTVLAAELPFGEFDVWVALGIAGVKAFLVAAYYMHLRYDTPLNAMLLVFSIVVVVLFLGVTLSDVLQLVPEVEAAEF
ncbi:MAG: cytochrome C oxidase subunit IV family protein [Planctomycetaceae bacterium]